MNKTQQAELDAFKQLAEEASDRPLQLLYGGSAKYAPMDETKLGEWRTVLSKGLPVALAWTDNEESFDVISLRSSPLLQDFREFVSNSRECSVPAGWAFQVLADRVQRFDAAESVSLGPIESGALAGVWEAVDRFSLSRATMSTTSVNGMENEDGPEV